MLFDPTSKPEPSTEKVKEKNVSKTKKYQAKLVSKKT
jgi:hypothetical protein